MNQLVLAEAKAVEAQVRSRINNAIRIVWAPKIQRFILCEDRLVTRADEADPWSLRDSDLEGAEYEGPWGLQPINEKTTLKTLVRLETLEGDYMEPVFEVIELVLAMCVKRRGDIDPKDYGRNAEKERNERFEKQVRSDYEDMRPTLRAWQANRVYSTPK